MKGFPLLIIWNYNSKNIINHRAKKQFIKFKNINIPKSKIILFNKTAEKDEISSLHMQKLININNLESILCMK